MKTMFRKGLSVFFAAALTLTGVGCQKTAKTASSSAPAASVSNAASSASSDDDFFSYSEAGTAGGTAASGGNTAATAPAANKVPGKSWAEVLKGMPASLKGTSITVYNWNPLTEYPGGSSAIAKFQKQTGIQVNWKVENFATYLTKLTSMVASGSAPDTARMRSPLVSNFLSMQPVYASKYDFNDTAWDKWLMNSYAVKGKFYGLNLANTHLATPCILLYNKSLIAKYDLDDPYMLWKRGQWTYDRFVQLMRDFKKAAKVDYVCSYFDYSELSQMFGVPGPITFDGTGYQSLVNDKSFISATQKIADLHNSEHLLERWKPDDFNSGKILFWSGTAIYARRQNAYFQSLKSSGSLFAVPFPKVSGQSNYYQLFGEVEAYGIPKGAKNPQAVPYFLRYFLDGGNYDLTSFFSNKEVLEVYNSCMSQKNKMWTTLYDEQANFYGNIPEDNFSKELAGATGAQVLSVLNSTASDINARIKRYNEQLASLK